MLKFQLGKYCICYSLYASSYFYLNPTTWIEYGVAQNYDLTNQRLGALIKLCCVTPDIYNTILNHRFNYIHITKRVILSMWRSQVKRTSSTDSGHQCPSFVRALSERWRLRDTRSLVDSRDRVVTLRVPLEIRVSTWLLPCCTYFLV